jgi:hypothetical protein
MHTPSPFADEMSMTHCPSAYKYRPMVREGYVYTHLHIPVCIQACMYIYIHTPSPFADEISMTNCPPASNKYHPMVREGYIYIYFHIYTYICIYIHRNIYIEIYTYIYN